MTANAPASRADKLLGFYVDKSRDLPWRARPGAARPDPYRVWLSEIMLQQTTVATVIPRFARFIERWPTFGALAAASDEEVMIEWAGLGYYARARNLLACARTLAAMGGFPATAAELRQLPGVGRYTSSAIAAIAFGEDTAPVDTNVERVLCRLNAIERPRSGEIEALFLELAPKGRAGDVAQALMDLGASICRPKLPRCEQCPLANDCLALASGNPASFPAPKVAKQRPQRFGVAYWSERDGHVWLVRRPAKGLLGGMAALPGPEWTDVEEAHRAVLARIRHVFTHFALELAIVSSDDPRGEGWWQPVDALSDAGLPTLYRRAAEKVLAARTRAQEVHRDPA